MRLPAHAEPLDGVRLLVVLVFGGYVGANLKALGIDAPSKPNPGIPQMVKPGRDSMIPAGMTEFSGVGKEGNEVEVLENGRVVGVGVVTNGQWTVRGKMFGPGKTTVFVRALGTGLQSALVPLTVKDRIEPTLNLLRPTDKEYIVAGRYMFKGTAKPGDEIEVYYNGAIKFKVKANADGKWWKALTFEQPAEIAPVRAVSRAEGEIVEVRVTGPG